MTRFVEVAAKPTLRESAHVKGVFFISPPGRLLDEYQKLFAADEAEDQSLGRVYDIGVWMFTHVLVDANGVPFEDMRTREEVQEMDFAQLSNLIFEFVEAMTPKKPIAPVSA